MSDRLHQLAPMALAKVRMQARVGVMADALADAAFCRALVQAVGARHRAARHEGHAALRAHASLPRHCGGRK
jgi:maltose alpha-D-glucosyltransferase/alpha-amylase